MANKNSHGSELNVLVMYKECLHNRAADAGESVLDGCGLFEASGPNGTVGAMVCAACHCHRNFHRRVMVDLPPRDDTQTENNGLPWLQVHQQTSRSRAPTSGTSPIPQPQDRHQASTSHTPSRAPRTDMNTRTDMNRPQGV